MLKNVIIKLTFICNTCGYKKNQTTRVNYKVMAEDMEDAFAGKEDFGEMPAGWSLTVGENYTLQCEKCTNVFLKKEGFM